MDSSICSTLKLVETAVFTSIQAKVEGTRKTGHSVLSVAEEGVGISPMPYTKAIKNDFFSLNGYNQTRWRHIQDIISLIAEGFLIVDDDSDVYLTNSSSTSHTTVDPSLITPAIGFPLSIVGLLRAIYLIKWKKRKRSK